MQSGLADAAGSSLSEELVNEYLPTTQSKLSLHIATLNEAGYSFLK